jgi:DNA-binding Xre family transcriptional regulator
MYEASDTIDNRKLIRVMTEKRMRTGELATQIGVTACTIAGLRSGRRETCRKSTTFRIADALGIEPVEIIAEA